MTNSYELADRTRADLIYEKQDLLAPLLPGMEQPPHPMRLGDDEQDYYLGGGLVSARSAPSGDVPSAPTPATSAPATSTPSAAARGGATAAPR